MLRELNRSGRRKESPDAPRAFVPRAWLPFVVSGEDKVSRRFWVLALLWRLRDSLPAGDGRDRAGLRSGGSASAATYPATTAGAAGGASCARR